jgi:hypothetical protein
MPSRGDYIFIKLKKLNIEHLFIKTKIPYFCNPNPERETGYSSFAQLVRASRCQIGRGVGSDNEKIWKHIPP